MLLSFTLLLAMLLGIFCIFAFTGSVTVFTNGNASANVSMASNVNSTLYIDVPKYVYVNNMTIYVEGKVT